MDGWRELLRDVVSGFLLGVIALPLAMALATAVGAPLQQGLYTAIVAGFLTALLGGSRIQVVGPTAAFIVVLAPLYARFGQASLRADVRQPAYSFNVRESVNTSKRRALRPQSPTRTRRSRRLEAVAPRLHRLAGAA